MNAIVASALAANGSMTVTDTSTSTPHTYTGSPGAIPGLAYPGVMRVYYAANSGALAASTTYCEQRGTATCYVGGVSNGTATLDMSSLPVSQLRYYDFAGDYVWTPGGTQASGAVNVSGNVSVQ